VTRRGGTPLDPRDEDLAQDVVRILTDALGADAVVGAFLHGSAVLGGLRETSDLDVLAVVARPTDDAERRAIVDRLLDVSGRRARRGPARPVELTIVQAGQLRPWRYPPLAELVYGEWLRDAFERGEVPEPSPNPDLAVIVTLIRAHGRALEGPPPEEALDPVPVADLHESIGHGVPGLLDDAESDTRNVLLTLARIWCTLETGEIRTKDAAASWAAERMPGAMRAPVDRAREMYLDGVDEEHWGERWPAAESAARWLAAVCQTSAR
jgi:streptomycin 3"-adenylyltransferase